MERDVNKFLPDDFGGSISDYQSSGKISFDRSINSRISEDLFDKMGGGKKPVSSIAVSEKDRNKEISEDLATTEQSNIQKETDTFIIQIDKLKAENRKRAAIRRRAKAVGLKPLPKGKTPKTKRQEWINELEKLEQIEREKKLNTFTYTEAQKHAQNTPKKDE